MTQIVFVKPDNLNAMPFTTSDVVAEYAGVKHHSVQRLISKYISDFESVGPLSSVDAPCWTAGGPQRKVIYKLSEAHFVLLVLLMSNTRCSKLLKQLCVRAMSETANLYEQEVNQHQPECNPKMCIRN